MNGPEALAPISVRSDASAISEAPAARLTPGDTDATSSTSFLQAISSGLDRVQSDNALADNAVTALATGQDIATHDVMLALEQARQSLLLATEVRQRLVEAYKEITGMQI